MKKIFTSLMMTGCLAALLVSSCKKDEVKAVAGTGSASVLAASTTTPALVKANLTATAITLTGTAQSYGYNAAVTYAFQMAVKGTNFAAPIDVPLPTGTLAKTYTVQDFNNILLGMNLPVNVAAQVDVRLKTSLSATAGITYSNTLTVTATPFALVSYIYVPGAYQGWNPPTADSLQSATGNGIYTGIINYTAGNLGFKITPKKVWDVAYGTAGSGKISTTGGDLSAPAAGQYRVTVDLNANTIVMIAADYYSFIGSATPGVAWTTDTDLKFNNGTSAWEGTVPLTVGAFKIRMNHAWGTSYGVPKTGADGTTLNNNDNNDIPVTTAGNYKFTFAPVYKIDGTTDVTAKYTLVKQ